MSSDHPVFKRFSRQQLIVRRRSIGFQTLVFETTQPKTPRCKHCGRFFNSVWKELLCHVCGLWVCQPCSSVIEREREINRIQYIRSCYNCISKLNKWSDPELLSQFALSPWIVQSSKSQLSLTLSDALRTKKQARHAVLVVLKHCGMPNDVYVGMIDHISEADWIAATTQEAPSSLLHTPSEQFDLQGKLDETMSTVESAQHLVQQCFDLVVPELPIHECVFAESNGTRTYPIFYDIDEEESVMAPSITGEEERELCIQRYNLLQHDHQYEEEMQLICDIAAKELDATTAFISVVRKDQQHAVSCRTGCTRSKLRRSETFCAFALTSSLPFLVRDAALDIRFRNFDVVRGSSHLLFYFGFPILAKDGTQVASLCVVDNKPRKFITTMQYTIMKKMAQIVSCLWEDAVMMAQI